MSDMNVQVASSTTQNVTEDKVTKKEMFKFMLTIELMILIEVGIPYILYYILKNFMKEVWASLIPVALPFLIAVYGLISRRRIDVMGGIIVLIFVGSAIMTLFKDEPDPRFQLLRKSAVSGVVSIMVVLTIIPLKLGAFQMRPLGFYLFRDLATGGTFGYINKRVNLPGLTKDEPIDERWERYWVSYQYFRRGFVIMTAIWGFGFLLEILVRYIIIFKLSLSIERATLFITILQNIWSLIISNLTFACIWWMRRRNSRIIDISVSDKPLE